MPNGEFLNVLCYQLVMITVQLFEESNTLDAWSGILDCLVSGAYLTVTVTVPGASAWISR